MMTKKQLLLLLLGLLLVAAPVARVAAQEDGEGEGEEDEDYDEKEVVVLTDANFDETLKKHKFALVEFYAPWCGHCKQLAPEYARAASALKAHDDTILIAKVDATAETALGSRFDVKGYPTLKWFVDGEATDYGGGRDEKAIVGWVKKKTGPPAVMVDSFEALDVLAADVDVTVLGYFKEFKGEAFDAFMAYASATDGLAFGQTTSAEVAAVLDLKAPGLAVKKSFSFEEGETIVPSAGELGSKEAVEAFVTANRMPLFVPFSQENGELIFESGLDKQLMFIGDAAALESEEFGFFKKVAAELAGQLVFVTVDTDKKDAEPVVQFFGIAADAAFPVIMGFSIASGSGKKYKLPGAVTYEDMLAFGKAMLDGSATPDYKSAPIPENDKDGEVTVVVGKTFDAIVKDEAKDVLLEVYAPWCGHCKQLEPIYKKLAKRFKKIDSVVVAKMDGTENEHPEVEIEGFPTLLFFPAGAKEPVPMDDERTLAAMIKFIKKHAQVPYELPKKSKSEAGEAAEDDTGHDEL